MATVVQDRGYSRRFSLTGGDGNGGSRRSQPLSLSLRSSSLGASLSLDSSIGVSLERSRYTPSSSSPIELPEISVKQLQRLICTSPTDTLRLSRADGLNRAARAADSPKGTPKFCRTLRLSLSDGFVAAEDASPAAASPTDALNQTLKLSPMAVASPMAPAGTSAPGRPAGSAAEAKSDPLPGQSLGEYLRGKRRTVREYYQVRSPEILLPAEGPKNDTTRVYNCGKALTPYQMGLSASEPSLPSTAARRGPPSPRGAASPRRRPSGKAAPLDPRSARGLVKTVSRVVVQYPEWDPYSLEGRPQRRPEYRAPLPTTRPVERAKQPPLPLESIDLAAMFRPSSGRRSARPDPKPVDAKALHRTVEQEEIRNISSTISQKGDPTTELAKSMVKLDNLYKMRRIDAGETPAAAESKHATTWPVQGLASGRSRSPSRTQDDAGDARPRTQDDAGEARGATASKRSSLLPEAGRRSGRSPSPEAGRSPSPEAGRESKANQETLLTKTLKDLQDTSEVLQVQADAISAAQDVVSQVGASRHATNVVIMRSYGVLLRKAYLLQRVERRLSEVEEASTEEARESTLGQLMSLDAPPTCLCGLPKFIKKHTHRPGDPIDADKMDFPAFVSSFRLPREHVTLTRLRQVTEENLTYWARAMHQQAVDGATKEQIEVLMEFARDLGADKYHPMIMKTQEVMKDRIADRILKFAEDAKAKDNQRALTATLKRTVPTFGLATKDADLTEQQILAAEEEGITSKTHPQIKTALEIVKKLRETDGERKRLMARDVRRVVRPSLSGKEEGGTPDAEAVEALDGTQSAAPSSLPRRPE